jgi:hypothetical protein
MGVEYSTPPPPQVMVLEPLGQEGIDGGGAPPPHLSQADGHMVAIAQEISIGAELPPPANKLSTSLPYVLQSHGGRGGGGCHTNYIYTNQEYYSVCPLVGIVTPTPHFERLEKSSALCQICGVQLALFLKKNFEFVHFFCSNFQFVFAISGS